MNIDRKLTEAEQEFIAILRDRFFLFPRDWWKAISSAIAIFAAAGMISWGAAKAALETSVSKSAEKEIVSIRDQARQHLADLQTGAYVKTGAPIRIQSKKHPKFYLQSHTPTGPTSSVDAATNAGREFIVWNIENVNHTP